MSIFSSLVKTKWFVDNEVLYGADIDNYAYDLSNAVVKNNKNKNIFGLKNS